jgi:hypothetical protein
MPSSLNADNGVVSGTAGLKSSADNSGVLDLQTNGTTAISISASQVVTFANQPAYTGGTANGVLYLNASKVLTSGSALVFDGTNLGVGVSSPSTIIHAKASGNYGTIFIDNSSTTGGGAFAARQNGSTKAILGVSGAIEGNTSSDAGLFSETGGGIRLYVNGSGTAVARIDSSGRLLVGTTSSIGTATVGRLQVLGGETFVTTNSEAGGFVGVNSNADNSLALVADVDSLRAGSHIAFYVDGFSEKARIDTDGTFYIKKASNGVHLQTQVGGLNSTALGSFNGAPTVGSNASGYSGIMFNGASFEPTLDGLNVRQSALVDIGSTGYRFKTGHFTGINFPATQVASADSNTLDDYEEGTFTPAFAAGTFTYGVRTGFYTKVGRLVTVNFFVMWSAKSGSGTLSVNGFPFTSTSAASYRATGAVGYTSGVGFAVGTQITWAMSQNYTGADLAIVITDAATQFADVSGMSAAGEIQGTISYIV